MTEHLPAEDAASPAETLSTLDAEPRQAVQNHPMTANPADNAGDMPGAQAPASDMGEDVAPFPAGGAAKDAAGSHAGDEPEDALPPVDLASLPPDLQDACARAGWNSLMPVQARALPYMLEGRDIMV